MDDFFPFYSFNEVPGSLMKFLSLLLLELFFFCI